MTTGTAGEVRSTTVNMASQLAAKTAHLVLNVVSTLAIVRYLVPADYGVYVLVLSVVTVAGVVADFGLPKLAVREMVRDGSADEVAGTMIALRLALAVGAAALCQLAVALFGQSPEAHLAAAVASLAIVAEAVLGILVAVFHVHLVQHYDAGIRVAAEAVETALVLAAVAAGMSLPWLFVPPVVGLVVGLLLAAALTRRRFGLRPRFVRGRVHPILIEALPLGPALLIGVLYLRLDSFVVAAMRPAEDLGAYGAAYQPIEYLFLGTAVVVNVLFPLLARSWSGSAGAAFTLLYRRGTELLVAVTLAVPATVLVLAPDAVATVFGPDYSAAAAPLRILSVVLVLMTVNAWQSIVLLTGGHQRVTLRYNLVALGLSLVSCVALVAAVGMVGAAISALITGTYVLWASTRAVRRLMGAHLDVHALARLVGVAVLTAGLVAALTLAGLPWATTAGIAAVVYVALHVRLGLLRRVQEALV